ncbi:MAG: septal ring lytic transglycosylase RlpA family protein [Thiogranum sp.]
MRSGKVSLTVLCVTTLLTACSTSQHSKHSSRYTQAQDSAPDRAVDVADVKDAIPRVEPKSRYGNPASYVVFGKRYHTLASSEGYSDRGIASWYGTKFHGHRTSSGEPYDMYQMSAAHKSLPLPSYARVTNLGNGKSVIVKINDRGPFHDNRIIDLSYAAASRLDILGKGTGLVEVQTIDPRSHKPEPAKRTILASKPKVAATQPVNSTENDSTEYKPALYLQIGAFLSRGNAERLKTRLSATELPATLQISEGMSKQKPIYRVRIGPLASVETADKRTQFLADQGIESPRVVID